MILAYRVILSFLAEISAGIDLSKAKTDPTYVSTLKALRAEWQRKGMQAVVPNEKLKEKILSTVAYVGYKNPDKLKQFEGKIFEDLHNIAVANKLTIFDKYDGSVTLDSFVDDLEAIKHELGTGTKLTPEELKIFNRVKIDKDFGDGWQWVYAVDESGEPIGYIPSSVCNKTMGHCGNEPSVRDGDVYYELRHNNKPYLTVILDADHKIKESKGPNNAPPKERELVAPKMKWFMTHERVKGTSYESGYARDKNLSILQFLEHDPEFLSVVEEKHPHLINEEVDKPIMEYRKALKEGRITEGEIIDKWKQNDRGIESGGLRLEHLRGILGRTPFTEDELVKYIGSGRLKADEIANTDHKYLTPKVQNALLQSDENSPEVFVNIAVSVPGSIVTKETIAEILEKYPNATRDFSEDIQWDFFKKYGEQFAEALKNKPDFMYYIPKNRRGTFLETFGAQFVEGLKKDPVAIKYVPNGHWLDFIQEYGEQVAEVLKEYRPAMYSVPIEYKKFFSGDKFDREGLKAYLESKEPTKKQAEKRVVLSYLRGVS